MRIFEKPEVAKFIDGIIEKATKIDGYITHDELRWLIKQARNMTSILEIGCFKGRSTLALLEASFPAPVYAIDHFEGSIEHKHLSDISKLKEIFMENCGAYENLRLFPVTSEEAYRSLFNPPQIDMVWIDGSHCYDDFKFDLEHWGPQATKLLCGHDPWERDVPIVLRENKVQPKIVYGRIWYKERGGYEAAV